MTTPHTDWYRLLIDLEPHNGFMNHVMKNVYHGHRLTKEDIMTQAWLNIADSGKGAWNPSNPTPWDEPGANEYGWANGAWGYAKRTCINVAQQANREEARERGYVQDDLSNVSTRTETADPYAKALRDDRGDDRGDFTRGDFTTDDYDTHYWLEEEEPEGIRYDAHSGQWYRTHYNKEGGYWVPGDVITQPNPSDLERINLTLEEWEEFAPTLKKLLSITWLTCDWCGEGFVKPEASSNAKKYCSAQCAKEADLDRRRNSRRP